MIIYYIKDLSVCPFSLMQSLMHKQTLHKFFTVSPVGMGKKDGLLEKTLLSSISGCGFM